MDLTNSTVKTPEAETETPTRIQPVKPSPFTNGVLKRHAPLHHHHHPVVVTYKECLKNHAAAIGGHAVDGCGEFMPSPTTNPADPSSLKCAACGCHRNFHRREPDEKALPPPNSIPAIEYQPHHRHHPHPPLPPAPRENSESSPNNSPSPPPISSAYYPSAPHMLLALGHGPQPPDPIFTNSTPIFNSSSGGRKRFRTKFTQDQKEKMLELADRVGWKMQKRDEDLINGFCTGIGVDKGVFKVWMHNNKNNFGKKDQNTPQLTNSNIATSTPPPAAAVNGSSGVSYGKCGAVTYASSIFDRMAYKNVWSWSAMILRFAQHGFATRALEYFKEMSNYSIKPNHVTYLGVLCACTHAGLVDEGKYYFKKMNCVYGIKPKMVHFGAMVDLLGRASLLKEAYDFILKMPIKPDGVIWRTLLSACIIHDVNDYVGVGEKVRRRLMELEPERSGNFVMVSKNYAEVGLWKKAAFMRWKMDDKGLEKIAGESCVEVNGSIFKFFSGDYCCIACEDVFLLLNRLNKHMRMIK